MEPNQPTNQQDAQPSLPSQPVPPPPIHPAPATTQPPSASRRARTGKIARLPKLTRDNICEMLQDGLPYLQILQRLGPEAAAVTEKNISDWKSGGYVDWLRDARLLEAIKARYELAQSIVAQSPTENDAGQAVLHVMATNICEFLAETDPSALRENLLTDADKFTRFVNSMVRLAEGGIKCATHRINQEDRTETAKRRANKQTAGITDESLAKAEEKLKLF